MAKNIIELPCSVGDFMLIVNNTISCRPKLYIGKVAEIFICENNEIWVTDYYDGEEDQHKIYDGCNVNFISKETAEQISELIAKGK